MATYVEDFYEKLTHAGIVPLVSASDIADASKLAETVSRGGLGAIEIELDADDAFDVIRQVKAACPELLVGAGEVTSNDLVDKAVAAGADYVSCPSYDDGIAHHCVDSSTVLIATTVDEGGIFKSGKLGLVVTGMVPAFDQNALATIDRFAAAFEGHLFMPRGGVDAHNAADYLADPSVIACGTEDWPIDSKLLVSGELYQIEREAAEATAIVRRTRHDR